MCIDNPKTSKLYSLDSVKKIPRENMISAEASSFYTYIVQARGKDFMDIIWSKKNDISYKDISFGSNKKIWMICENCGFERQISPHKYTSNGFSCPQCGDGFSYPNKVMFSILNQLNINFETEKRFTWGKYYYKNKIRNIYYDFYLELNNTKYIIEMDGGFHSKSTNKTSVEEVRYLDSLKDNLATVNNISIIRINCEVSDIEYIKKNILASKITNILDITKINWTSCNEYAFKSLIKKSCDLWESNYTINEISSILYLSTSTVTRYLNKGSTLNWCSYDSSDLNNRNFIKYHESRHKKVYCLELKRQYDSIKQASIETGVDTTYICNVCRGKQNTTGGFHWVYYDDYLQGIKKNNASNSRSKIICIETLKIYNSIKEAENEFGGKRTSIGRCCKNKKGTSHGYHWLYYLDYINGVRIDTTSCKLSKD
jgi:very-short-patch-repair endonuclease